MTFCPNLPSAETADRNHYFWPTFVWRVYLKWCWLFFFFFWAKASSSLHYVFQEWVGFTFEFSQNCGCWPTYLTFFLCFRKAFSLWVHASKLSYYAFFINLYVSLPTCPDNVYIHSTLSFSFLLEKQRYLER